MNEIQRDQELLDLIKKQHYLEVAHDRRNKRAIKGLYQSLILFVAFMALVVAIIFAFIIGIDKHIDNQNTMLCESAKISKNEVYTEACDAYYDHGDIKYMRNFDASKQN